MSFLTDGIGDAFDFVAQPLENIGEGVLDIAEAAVEGVEEIGEVAIKMSKVLVKSLVIALKLIAKMLPLAELVIYAAPTFALIYTYAMALNALKDLDLGETYNKFRPKINQLLILSGVVLEWFIYNVDGLGWQELYPGKDSSLDLSVDFGIFGLEPSNISRAQKRILPTSAPVPAGTDRVSGKRFKPGDLITSVNGAYAFEFQQDGNGVLFEVATRKPYWQTNTRGKMCVMQIDGNLVVYDDEKGINPAWQSGTAGNSNATLVVQNDANLAIYVGDLAIWSTNASRSAPEIAKDVEKAQYNKAVYYRAPKDWHQTMNVGQYIRGDVWVKSASINLLFQTDGNLVLNHNRVPIWQSGTAGRGHRLNLQSDATMTIQDVNQNVIWSSHNQSPPEKAPFRMEVQADTNLVIYDKYNGVVWSRM